jgi:hypothetical protein
MTGKWPTPEIDYINGNRSDTRWANLREATRSQNSVWRHTRNKLGVKGVWVEKNGAYVAQIRSGGKLKYLGTFDTVSQAAAAYAQAAREAFGEFARTTR